MDVRGQESGIGERVYQAILHPSADIRLAPAGDAKAKFRTRQSVTMIGRLVPDAEHGDRRVWFEVELERGERGYIHQMSLKSVRDHHGAATANAIGTKLARERRQSNTKLARERRESNELKLFTLAALGLLAIFSLVAFGLSGR